MYWAISDYFSWPPPLPKQRVWYIIAGTVTDRSTITKGQRNDRIIKCQWTGRNEQSQLPLEQWIIMDILWKQKGMSTALWQESMWCCFTYYADVKETKQTTSIENEKKINKSNFLLKSSLWWYDMCLKFTCITFRFLFAIKLHVTIICNNN